MTITQIEAHPAYSVLYYNYLRNRGKSTEQILDCMNKIAADRK